MRNLKILAFSVFFISALALIGLSLRPAVVARFSGTIVSPETASLTGKLVGQSLTRQLNPEENAALQPVTGRKQQGQSGDKLVIGGTYSLESGESLDGSLLILGGSANLEQGSTVEKDVTVIGGTINVNGQVKGDVSAVGGMVSLGSTAVIGGDVNTLAGQLTRDDGARIEGQVNTGTTGPFSLVVPGTVQIPGLQNLPPITLPRDFDAPVMNVRFNPVMDGLWWLIRSFFWAALAVLVALFLSQRTERVAESVIKSPLVAGGMGCLTILIVPLILLVLVITICGIPFALLGTFALWLAWVFGIIVIGYEIGKRLAQLLKADWAIPVSAGIGTFALTLGLNGIGALVPCVGWMAPAAVGLVGLGAVLLTRFGGRVYPYDEPENGGTGAEQRLPVPLPTALHLEGEGSANLSPAPDSLPLPGDQTDKPDAA
jgi:cytoskeletal protein CcmA (bactofilin family)